MTNNLTHRHMQCDNHCPECGAEHETINHTIFKCPPALQTWFIAATLSHTIDVPQRKPIHKYGVSVMSKE